MLVGFQYESNKWSILLLIGNYYWTKCFDLIFAVVIANSCLFCIYMSSNKYWRFTSYSTVIVCSLYVSLPSTYWCFMSYIIQTKHWLTTSFNVSYHYILYMKTFCFGLNTNYDSCLHTTMDECVYQSF